ncbi:MAG TPA: PQQ-binding-like beta-propeller repeat protein [Myxococcaceae bacterium]|nr:PQQ-binding-like beta-propeller repeat protein [Myxococcaceae bacterium]
MTNLSSPWPMADADPRASRRSTGQGPAQARVRWTFDARPDLQDFAEPLVLPDGRIVLSGSGPGGERLLLLSPEGTRAGQVPGIGSSGVTPVLSPHGLLFAPSGGTRLVALTLDFKPPRWTRELARRPDFLRGTPRGDLLAFTVQDRYLVLSRHGAPRWHVLQDLTGTAAHGLAAFDGQGHCYTAESAAVFRRGPDVTWQAGLSVLGPDGVELWSEVHEPTDGVNLHEVEHLWGLDEGAVLFGRTVRCLGPTGETRWELARPEDFARTVAVGGTELVLGWDARLTGAPRLVVLNEGTPRHLPTAVDVVGNAYACSERFVFSLAPDFRERWRFELESPAIGGPVIGPGGLLLVRSAGGLVALG